MSKIDKNIQDAREWRKKHEAESLDFTELDQALAAWETQVKNVAEAKALLATTKTQAIVARKAVGVALAQTKVARKTPKAAPSPREVPAPKAVTKKVAPAKKPPRVSPAPEAPQS